MKKRAAKLTPFRNFFKNPKLKLITSFYQETPAAVNFEIRIKILQILKETKKSIIKLLDVPNYVMERCDVFFPYKDFLFYEKQNFWIYYLHKLVIDEFIYGIGDFCFIDEFPIFETFLIPNNEFIEMKIINQNDIKYRQDNSNYYENFLSSNNNDKEDDNIEMEKSENWYGIIDSFHSKNLSDQFCPNKKICDKYLDANRARRDNDLINQLHILFTSYEEENMLKTTERNLNITSSTNSTPITPDYHLHENNDYEVEEQCEMNDMCSMLYSF